MRRAFLAPFGKASMSIDRGANVRVLRRLVGLLASVAMAAATLLVVAPPAGAYVGPVSNSWYITAADLASSGGGIYSSGYNAPSGPQVVFLQAGQVCITSTGGSGFLSYGGGMPADLQRCPRCSVVALRLPAEPGAPRQWLRRPLRHHVERHVIKYDRQLPDSR